MMTRFLLHNLTLPAEEESGYIGVWGQRRLNYLKHHRKVLYYNLLTSGKLHSHLDDTEKQAQQLFSPVGKTICRKRKRYRRTQIYRYDALGVLKMNNISNRATEVMNSELIFVRKNKKLSAFNRGH